MTLVARSYDITVRYLHRLFESERLSVADVIRTRRLERCRRDLLDPTLADRPVSATGARWGFVNLSHFNRLFRDTFGIPPGEFRLRFGGSNARAAARPLTTGVHGSPEAS